MEDVDLNDLIQQFQTLQRTAVSSEISERHVVEIVNILVKKKLIEVLYTTDAKEYLTWDELRREIVDEVYANGGRLNVVDLPGLLSVNANQVEHVLPQVLEDNPELLLENGELMSQRYVDTAVQAAGDMLTEVGSFALSTFAMKYQFSSAFAMSILFKAVQEKRLQAVIQGTAFYTSQFVRSQCIILRSGLLAAERPIDLNEFFDRHKLFSPLLSTLMERVLDELPGTYDGTVYTPSVFEEYRTSQVHNIYTSNGHIDYLTLQRMGISGPRQYLLHRYNPLCSAQDAATAQTASTTAGGKRGGRRRTAAKQPTAEAATTLVRASESHPLCGYALSSCFLSDRLLANLMALTGLIEGDFYAVDLTQSLPTTVDLGKDWTAVEPRLRELFPGLEECELVGDCVLIRHDAHDKAKGLLLEALQTTAVGTKRKKNGGPVNSEKIAKTLYAQFLHLPEDLYDGVLTELSDRWSDVLQDVLQALEAASQSNTAASLKASRAKLHTEMDAAWTQLGVVAKGLQWAQGQLDETATVALNRHVLGTKCYELCRSVVLNESLDSADLHEQVQMALTAVSSATNFKKCLVPFTKEVRASLTPLADLLNGKDVEQFMATLQEMCGTGAIAVSSFHATNKKVERDTYAAMRATAEAAVKRSTFTSDAGANGALFVVAITLLLHLMFRIHLDIPGKTVGAVVAKLIQDPRCPQGLVEAQHVITSCLLANEDSHESVEILEKLRGAVLALT